MVCHEFCKTSVARKSALLALSVSLLLPAGAKEFSESGKSVIDAAAARAERQLLRMRVKARKGKVREQRAASAKN